MGKYVAYVIIILLVLFGLEFFEVVDIPFLEIPDYLSGKEKMVDGTGKALEQLK